MFKRLRLPLQIILCLLIFSTGLRGFAQVRNKGRDWIKTRAYRDFNDGLLEKAFIGFSELLTRYPEDPVYYMFKGACQVELQIELEEAIELLEYAREHGAPPEVHYFLGKAHLKLYQFDLARKELGLFRKKADKRLRDKYGAGLLSAMIDKAEKLTKQPLQVEVVQNEELPYADLSLHYDLSSLGGQIVYDSAVLKEELEDLELSGDRLFIHDSDLHYLYFSAKTGNGKGSYDIYRMKYRRGRVYGSPERLPEEINTGLDERYPFFDRQQNLLYFSSEGHGSMGGLDIYSSAYDSRRKKWSPPEQLGFPVNSTSDDFLFVPIQDSNSILLASSREVASGYVHVFRIATEEFPVYLNPVPEDYDPASCASLIAPPQVQATAEFWAGADGYAPPTELINDGKYNALINESLSMQARSDSFAAVARQTRVELEGIDNKTERGLLQKLILQMEARSRYYRQMADSTYRHARDYESAFLQKNPGNEFIIPDRTISGITVYRYRTGTAEDPSPVDASNVMAGNPVIYESVGDFRVYMYPPYNANNPVPFNEKLTDGILYRIQLGAFANPVDFHYFRGISPISAERTIDGKLTRYYAGKFTSYQDARKALQMVREYGFEDAFLVAYINTNKLPVPRVKVYEEQLRDYYE